ncbi:MAG: glycosyltransferase family 2 protein, partial [bacterium]|nr:glycosyltransferase family 2 protein [bacterium]
EKFFPELYVWNRIGDDGPILFFADETIYRCEYLPDGYTANFMRILKRNPRGLLVYYRDQYSRERAPIRKLKCLVRALQCSWYVFAGRVRP